ncbi:MAG: PDZ domain-containing protein, partial [Planctomycetota bacterium]
AKGGLQKGDILLKIQGKGFRKFQNLVKWLEMQKPGQMVEIEILRGKKKKTIKIILGAKIK